MFYFANNEENIKRRGNKEHSELWDDCGAWESGTSPATLFTEVGGKLISVKLYKSLYVTEKRVNKKYSRIRTLVNFHSRRIICLRKEILKLQNYVIRSLSVCYIFLLDE